MRRTVASVLLPAVVLLAWAELAHAQPGVHDLAKMFSPAAVAKANEQIAAIYRDSQLELVIETFPAVPENLRGRQASMGEKEFFAAWAKERAAERRVEGVYILLCRNPGKLQYFVHAKAKERGFSPAVAESMSKNMLAKLKERKFDDSLAIATTVFADAVARGGKKAVAPVAPNKDANLEKRSDAPLAGGVVKAGPEQHGEGEGEGWTWLLYVALALLGLWILFALFRGASQSRSQAAPPPTAGYGPNMGPSYPGYGQPGYGPVGYPPPGYPAPQGGGFMRGMLGGMLGAAGGMWLYNHLFGGPAARGDMSGGSAAAPHGGDFSGGDFTSGGFTGGGDFGGSDFGGGDFGGADFGGGDFGGGDFGGGGDF